jgi:hypothetical protein
LVAVVPLQQRFRLVLRQITERGLTLVVKSSLDYVE